MIVLAALMAVVLPELDAPADNTQITARVSPTIVDLVAAAATGLAGAFAVARRDIGDILPGVAIAISLVPPLAVVGVTAVDGDWDGALGALLLFSPTCWRSSSSERSSSARSPGCAARGASTPRVYAVVGLAGVVVVAALAVATTAPSDCQLARRRAAGSRRAGRARTANGSCRRASTATSSCSSSRADGRRPGQPAPATARRRDPGRNPVVVNRVAGTRQTIGDVGR